MDVACETVEQRAQLHVEGLLAGDVATLEDVLADSLVWTHSSGTVDSKASFIAPFRDGPSRYKAFDRRIEKIRTFDGMTILHGVVGITSQSGDVVRQINNRFIAIWTISDGAWRLCAWQSTREPDRPS